MKLIHSPRAVAPLLLAGALFACTARAGGEGSVAVAPSPQGGEMKSHGKPSDEELKKRLTPIQ